MNEQENSARFPIFHVPHDGVRFPATLMRAVCVPPEQFLEFHRRMRDVGTLDMVPPEFRSRTHTMYFPVSRLLCDVERFLGPEEAMERYGMGFCYERAFDGTQIKQVTELLRQETLRFYAAHHARLDSLCRLHPRTLLLDLHSFSDELVPRAQLRRGVDTPDLCLGIDERYTPPRAADAAEALLREAGFSTARNYPYAGSMVPNAVLTGKSRCDCASLMLEWNRRVYCGADGRPDAVRLAQLRDTVRRIAEKCSAL